jgi:hypothetical protein
LEIDDWLVGSADPAVIEMLGAEKQGRKKDAEYREGADDVKLASKPHFRARISETKAVYKAI